MLRIQFSIKPLEIFFYFILSFVPSTITDNNVMYFFRIGEPNVKSATSVRY